jgi:hypothetical protein
MGLMTAITLVLATSAMALAQDGVSTFTTPSGGRQIVGAGGGPPIPPKPTSFDCAADGTVVNAITGEPIPRARVIVSSAGSPYATATDNTGRWSLSNLACGSGQLNATRPGYLQNAAARRGPLRRGAFQSLTLAPGSPVHELKIELIPQSVVFGRVVDEQGDPVMGANVIALLSAVVVGKVRFQQSGLGNTDDLGQYRIANLPRGRYIFCAHLNQQNFPTRTDTQTMTADTCYPGPLEGGTAGAMEVPAGRETKLDFVLNQVLGIHVRGTVSGLPEGRGIGINLVKRGVNSDFRGNQPATVRDGKFDIRAAPGSYMLTANYFEGGKRLMARVPIEAGSSDIDGIALHLESGFTVTGLVRFESQSGQAPAKPSGLRLNLRSSEPNNGGGGQVKWDADRTTFSINDMAPGSYGLDAFAAPPFYVKSATLAGQDILRGEIPISQAAGPIEIVLRDDGGSIEGDVVDADGKPAPSGIMLLRGDGRLVGPMPETNGHFKLQNIAPGDYVIYAWDDPNSVEYANADWMRRYAGNGSPVTITAGQNVQVKLTQQQAPPQ